MARRISVVVAACGAFAGGTGGCSGERPGPPPTTVTAALAPSALDVLSSPLRPDRSTFVNSHTNQTLPLREARHTLENARKDHAAAKEYLDAVEERARRAGMLPGWLR